MTGRRALILVLAVGLPAFFGGRAVSLFKAPVLAEARQSWVCPMRCQHRIYQRPGECPVCHMKLQPQGGLAGSALMGYRCPLKRSEKVFARPGPCPFCGLFLKAFYEGAPFGSIGDPLLRRWPALGGKTAVYLRPYELRELAVERFVRAAGPLKGRHLRLRLSKEERQGLRRGASAMVRPPLGSVRPLLGKVSALGPGDEVEVELPSPLAGSDWAVAELRVTMEKGLAVPLNALNEEDGAARVYVLQGDAFEPRTVTVLARGETYARIEGLKAGESVAGSGLFWLEAQWRMDHP